MNFYFSRALLVAVIGLPLSSLVFAQSSSPIGHRQAPDTTGIAARTETTPLDDAVLNLAPELLSLSFPDRVRLVKLILRTDQHDWVDISFRYNPQAFGSYQWQLPELAEAAYYTADWAILAANERLVRGSFSFSFGADAEPPSIVKEAQKLLLELRYGDPTIRYVRPPRTQIILGQDPISFDPPFTIQLEDEDQNKPSLPRGRR